MSIQEAVNKAVEGGYHLYGADGMDTTYVGANSELSAWTRRDNDSSFMIPTEETFLDPRFWQALGHALGWSEACDLAITCVHGCEECQQRHGYYWMYQWHFFIQVIADGSTTDAFFAQLPSSQPLESAHQHEANKEPLRPSLLWLIVEEARQHAQQICEEAAGAQEVAKDIVQMTRLARQRRSGCVTCVP
jgi:hypothetical protein